MSDKIICPKCGSTNFNETDFGEFCSDCDYSSFPWIESGLDIIFALISFLLMPLKLTRLFKCCGNSKEKNGEILHLLCKQTLYISYVYNFVAYKSIRTF